MTNQTHDALALLDLPEYLLTLDGLCALAGPGRAVVVSYDAGELRCAVLPEGVLRPVEGDGAWRR